MQKAKAKETVYKIRWFCWLWVHVAR